MGQIIIIYLASNSNRNREDHVWALLCSPLQFAHCAIYIHLCIFSTPSAVNQHMLQRKIPIGQ